MNVGRWIIASIVVAIAIYITDWILHGLILAGVYEMCKGAFETPKHIAEWTWLVPINALIFGFLLGYVYVRMGKSYTVGAGLGFGLLLGLLMNVPRFLYGVIYLPYPKAADIGWLIGGIVQFLIYGFLLGLIYKPKLEAPQKQPQPGPQP